VSTCRLPDDNNDNLGSRLSQQWHHQFSARGEKPREQDGEWGFCRHTNVIKRNTVKTLFPN